MKSWNLAGCVFVLASMCAGTDAAAQTSPPPFIFVVHSQLQVDAAGNTLQILKKADYTSLSGGSNITATGLTALLGSTFHTATVSFSDKSVSGSLSTTSTYNNAQYVPTIASDGADSITYVDVWVLGPPGTPYRYSYTVSGTASGFSVATPNPGDTIDTVFLDAPTTVSVFPAGGGAYEVIVASISANLPSGVQSRDVTGVTSNSTGQPDPRYSWAGEVSVNSYVYSCCGDSLTFSATGTASASFTVTFEPSTISAPTNLVASQTDFDGQHILLAWDYGSDPIDGFNIYRKPVLDNWPPNPVPVKTVPFGLGPYGTIDTTIPASYDAYTYRVTAYQGADESSPSNEDTAFQIETTISNASRKGHSCISCEIDATFTPVGNAQALDALATALGFHHFNWISVVDVDPEPPPDPANPTQPLKPPYVDPPKGGYLGVSCPSSGLAMSSDDLPFYWDEETGFPNACSDFYYKNYIDGYSLYFHDLPVLAGPNLPTQYLGFITSLVGVICDGSGVICNNPRPAWPPLASINWNSTFNGWGGTVGVRSNLDPPTMPGSGEIFNVRILKVEDLPQSVRVLFSQAGAQGVSTAPYVDTNAPMTAAFLAGTQGANGAYSGPVTVTLIATDIDGPSDVASTTYSIDGGSVTDYNGPFAVSGNGIHTIEYGSVDRAGNIEAPRPSQTINIGVSPLLIKAFVTPTVLSPTGSMVNVTVSGGIANATSGVNGTSVTYAVVDEYGSVQPSGTVPLRPNGSFSFSITLQASRLDADLDGRTYTITITAQDNAGNQTSTAKTVVVTHDQGG